MSTSSTFDSELRQAIDTFYDEFQLKRRVIQNQIDTVTITSELSSQLSTIQTQINQLKDEYKRALIYLPGYDQKSYELFIKELDTQLQTKLQMIQPKPKFSFKQRNLLQDGSVVIPSTLPLPTKPEAEAVTTKDNFLNADAINFTGRSNEVVQWGSDTLPLSADKPLSVHINQSHHCLINLVSHQVTLASLFIERLTNCIVLIPPVSSSVLIQDCQNCIFVLACHQFRMHQTKSSKIYLHVTSNPIIEECQDLGFAPYHLQTTFLSDLFKKVKLSDDIALNKCHQVEDFNWRKQSASPHWYKIIIVDPIFDAETLIANNFNSESLLTYLNNHLVVKIPNL